MCFEHTARRAELLRIRLSREISEKGRRGQGGKTYNRNVGSALMKIRGILDCICGKRLAPMLKEVIRIIERYKEIKLDLGTRKKLYKISAATIDWLLAQQRKK